MAVSAWLRRLDLALSGAAEYLGDVQLAADPTEQDNQAFWVGALQTWMPSDRVINRVAPLVPTPSLSALGASAQYPRGPHNVRDACVEQLRARQVTVEGAGLLGFGDGEMLGATPLTVTSVPRALPVFVPRGQRC